jgi:hypothetical protein
MEIPIYGALYDQGISTELHVFRSGAHGSGLGVGDPSLDEWPSLLEHWLRDQGLLSAATGNAKAEAKQLAPAAPRKPGERLTIDSRIADLLSDPRARAVIADVCGEAFVEAIPDYARGV